MRIGKTVFLSVAKGRANTLRAGARLKYNSLQI